MPVFNDRKYLCKALESLRAQSFSDFELIISDDCSSDGSAELCLEFANRDPRIKYIRQQKNIGISRNMEFLLQQAKGKYFMWAANDDVWDKDFIATLLRGFDNSSTIVSVFCPMTFIDKDGNLLDSLGIRCTDYSGVRPFIRLKKLVRHFDDAFGYGLFLREKIQYVRFPVWWGRNRSCAYDNIYPTLCYYLALGDFKIVGEKPLWFNRLKPEAETHHEIPFNNTFLRGYFYYALRCFNLSVVSIGNVFRVKHSFFTGAKILPYIFFKWFLLPSYSEMKIRVKALVKGDISFW